MSEKWVGFEFQGQGDERRVFALNGTELPPGMLHVPPPLSGESSRIVSAAAIVAEQAADAFARDVQRDSEDRSGQ
jgi:hypothetical protein